MAYSSPGKKLYVGNIDWNATEEELKEHFMRYGYVESVEIVRYHDTGRSRGFGFVLMASDQETEEARQAHETELRGRKIYIKDALPPGELPKDSTKHAQKQIHSFLIGSIPGESIEIRYMDKRITVEHKE